MRPSFFHVLKKYVQLVNNKYKEKLSINDLNVVYVIKDHYIPEDGFVLNEIVAKIIDTEPMKISIS